MYVEHHLKRSLVKRRVATHGRDPDSILVMPGVLPVIGKTEREAHEKFDTLQALIHPALGIAVLSEIVNLDLSQLDLDGPLPDAPTTNRQQGRQQVVYDMARKENLSIRKSSSVWWVHARIGSSASDQ